MDFTFLKEPAMVWFLIGLVLIVSEFAVPGLVIIFFGLGAWATALALLAIDMSLFFPDCHIPGGFHHLPSGFEKTLYGRRGTDA